MKQFTFVSTILLLDFIDVSSNIFLQFLPILLLVIYILRHSYVNQIKGRFRLPAIILLFYFLLFVGLLRSSNPYSNTLLNFYRFLCLFLYVIALRTYIIISFKQKTGLLNMFFWAVFMPFLYFVIIDLILYSLNIGLDKVIVLEQGNSVLLESLGLDINRDSLGFITGFSKYRILLGLLLTMSLIGFSMLKRFKIAFLCGIVCSLLINILVDNRAAVIFPILIFLLYKFYFGKDKKPKYLWTIPLVTIFGSSLLLYILSLPEIPGLDLLSRNDGDFSTANGRSFIWLISSGEFLDFKPIHLIGYGDFGHYISGASEQWADIFGQWENNIAITPHSTFFVLLFDYGYIGLIFYIFLQYHILATIKRNWNFSKDLCIILLSLLIYINFAGVTESFFGFYAANFIYLFSSICIFVYFMDYANKQKFNSIIEENHQILQK